jgi:hypothetical protein
MQEGADIEDEKDFKLKRTTVLTGNHGAVKQTRMRAQSENEIFTPQFKAT